eukprot:scaffold2991_cov403-Prasinococcus_capsulatus_cf.AAC.15
MLRQAALRLRASYGTAGWGLLRQVAAGSQASEAASATRRFSSDTLTLEVLEEPPLHTRRLVRFQIRIVTDRSVAW